MSDPADSITPARSIPAVPHSLQTQHVFDPGSPNPGLDSALSATLSPGSPYAVKRKSVNPGSTPVSPDEGLQPERPRPYSATSYNSAMSGASTLTRESYQPNARLLGDEPPPQADPTGPPGGVSDSPEPRGSEPRAWWNISRSPSWAMYICYLFGIGVAFGHHFFYSSLAGKPADNQLLMLRYGAALAYLVKASFVAAVALAYRQQVWATCTRKGLKMSTLDCLFAAADDLTALFNLEFMKMARVGLTLALIIWVTPLTAILTPATLNVALSSDVINTHCPSIRTLNFSREADKDWRVANRMADNLPELSVSSWNSTSNDSSAMVPFNSTFFDYWTAPSSPIINTVTLSANLKRPWLAENASLDICGVGWNCSYVINFVGPGVQCLETPNPAISPQVVQPFDRSWLVPQGNLSYLAALTLGEYSSTQIASVQAGAPIQLPPFPQHLGAFRTEPVLWFGYATLVDSQMPLPRNRSADPNEWATAFKPTVQMCELYETNYTIQINYTLSNQVVTVLNQTFLNRVINTIFDPTVEANDGTLDNTTALPESNYLYPIDVGQYRITGAYHSISYLARQFLNGTIDFSQPEAPIANTEALRSRLIDPGSYLVVPSFVTQLQQFYIDILMSMFSNPSFISVVWAASPSQSTGAAPGNDSALLYPCTKTRDVNKYVYSSSDLWIVYGLSIILTGLGVCLGAAAVAQNNNRARQTRFSSILGASRDASLAALPWVSSRWGTVPEEVLNVRLRYGRIDDGAQDYARGEAQEAAYGFAPVDKVIPLGNLSGGRSSVLSFQSLE